RRGGSDLVHHERREDDPDDAVPLEDRATEAERVRRRRRSVVAPGARPALSDGRARDLEHPLVDEDRAAHPGAASTIEVIATADVHAKAGEARSAAEQAGAATTTESAKCSADPYPEGASRAEATRSRV